VFTRKSQIEEALSRVGRRLVLAAADEYALLVCGGSALKCGTKCKTTCAAKFTNMKSRFTLLLLLLLGIAHPACRAAKQPLPTDPEPWLKDRLEWFQDLKFGFMMHFGAYSQWGCIESWPLVEEDKWARPDNLPAWVERGKDMERFKRDYRALPKTFNPVKFDPNRWAEAAKGAGMK
jgi:Alpha-L-fucosidase